MVSLYRAWAAWRGIGIPGAPDALIQVGGVRFTAHARLLAAHSGYFKSVLSVRQSWTAPSQSGTYASADEIRSYEESKEGEGYETEYERERRELENRYQEMRNESNGPANAEENVVYVPNITAQQFWPLLAYMYTGYLELTPENIYQVLLATHLLHMPRALELCRNFLSHSSSGPNQSTHTNVVKPIPSRKLPTFLSAPVPYRPLFTDTPIQYMGSPYETPFKPVESSSFPNRASVIEATVSASQDEVEVGETRKEEEKTFTNLTQSSEKNKQIEFLPSSEISTPKIEKDNAVNLIKTKKNKTTIKRVKEDCKTDKTAESSDNVVILKEKPDYKSINANDDKVIIDVACCDGPVRFHRVLNKAYKSTETESSANAADSSDSDDSYVEIEEDSRSQSDTPYDNCNAFSKSLQKQMSENIRNMTSKHNENNPGYLSGDDNQAKVDGADDASNSLLSNKSQDTIYTCVYCNHTFKSQYCYQKHARRHINPVSIDAVNQGTVEFTPDECCKIKKIGIKLNPMMNPGPKREVRLLDMNVQYYPCKTCGSKFPSYYFVHKHRKMCHAEELDGNMDLGNKSTIGAAGEKKRKLSGNFEESQAEENNEGSSSKPEKTT